jgi:hypothetical protein
MRPLIISPIAPRAALIWMPPGWQAVLLDFCEEVGCILISGLDSGVS